MNRKQAQIGLKALVEGDLVRRATRDGRTLFAATDVVAALVDAPAVSEAWETAKRAEPELAKRVELVLLPGVRGQVEMLDLAGLLRLVQAISSPRAEKLKAWLAESAAERLAEAENPELAILRTRRLYEGRGRSRRWIDNRLRGVSGRQELTSEWHRRGAEESEQFRELTNLLMRGAFGMDVEAYRHRKGLTHTRENLRDHMSDLELSLVALAETVAVELHRERQSQGFEALAADAEDAGEVVAGTRARIEEALGQAVA